jgi:hypothetical protein
MIVPFGTVVATGIRQIAEFVRNLPNPSYWTPQGGTLNTPDFSLFGLEVNVEDLRRSWVNRFLAPIANAMCQFVTNSACVLSLILGETCAVPRYSAVSAYIRYFFEWVINVIATVEGLVKLFAQEQPGQCIGLQSAGNADPHQEPLERTLF